MWLTCGAITSTVRSRPISRNSFSPVASNWRTAEPNWKPCVHSVQPRLVYLPPMVKTGAPAAGAQDFSIDRILAAESSNSRWSFGASAPKAGADCVSTIPRNFNLSVLRRRVIVYRGGHHVEEYPAGRNSGRGGAIRMGIGGAHGSSIGGSGHTDLWRP